jgi:hypothetical protein
MAIPIKPPPVLEGKAAQEFHERWANAKDDTSKEEAQKIAREWRAFFAEQKHLHPSSW